MRRWWKEAPLIRELQPARVPTPICERQSMVLAVRKRPPPKPAQILAAGMNYQYQRWRPAGEPAAVRGGSLWSEDRERRQVSAGLGLKPTLLNCFLTRKGKKKIMAGGLCSAVVLCIRHQGRQDSISITALLELWWHCLLGPGVLCRVMPWVLRLPWGHKPAGGNIPGAVTSP